MSIKLGMTTLRMLSELLTYFKVPCTIEYNNSGTEEMYAIITFENEKDFKTTYKFLGLRRK